MNVKHNGDRKMLETPDELAMLIDGASRLSAEMLGTMDFK